MKLIFLLLLVFTFGVIQKCSCQQRELDQVEFFKDARPLNVTIESYWSKIIKQRYKNNVVFSGRFIYNLSDSILINEQIGLQVRGHFRRDYCYLPPLKLFFAKDTASFLRSLNNIKLVNACRLNSSFEQYIFKEFITYKIYNLITDKSFRVKLLNVQFKDIKESKASIIQTAFLLEDLKELSKRNNCTEAEEKINTEATDRFQMTIVAIFQYMIGNTDWSVRALHNIKLIKSPLSIKPLVIPYDFDYAGLVNTDYAVPDPLLQISNVRSRVYRGFERNIEELNIVLELFKQQKENIFQLIKGFDKLTAASKKSMINYLDEFYDIIKNPKKVKVEFIDKARSTNSL